MRINTAVGAGRAVALALAMTVPVEVGAGSGIVPLSQRPHPCSVRVALDVRTLEDAVVIQTMQREVERIWRPHGVAVTWTPDRGARPASVSDVALRVTLDASTPAPARQRPRGHRPLAWIWFVDGRPTEAIHVSAAHARQVLESARIAGRRLTDRPALFLRYVGTALGRSLAHEIGHYLLASPFHSGSGLMQGTFTTTELLTNGRFELEAADEIRLAEASEVFGYCAAA